MQLKDVPLCKHAIHQSESNSGKHNILDASRWSIESRIKSALPEDTKCPVILSKDQRIATLNFQHIHEELGHSGRNHMLARLRQKFWIPKSNSAIRQVIA